MAKGGEGVFRCKVGAAAMGNSLYVVIHNFSTLKRVVKGQCSCGPLRGSIHIKPEKVKCKCNKKFYVSLILEYQQCNAPILPWDGQSKEHLHA